MISGGDPETALLTDGADNQHYALNFVVRADRKDDPRILRFVEIYRSPEVKTFIQEHYGKYIRPVW
jgi:D-methionine transport system substrate-binding protein